MMQGASQRALDEVRETLSGSADVHHGALGGELLAVAVTLSSNPTLRHTLTDYGIPGTQRAAIARAVFGSKISDAAAEVVGEAAGRRWSAPRDLVDGVEALGVEAILAGAEADGHIDAVEDEIFRVTRALAGSPELQALMTDPVVADERKAQVMVDLLQDRAQPETVTLVRHMVAHRRGRRVSDVLDTLVDLAARRREVLIADVRAPIALTPEQQQRLKAALEQLYGHRVNLAVSVEPSLLGGAVVRVADEIIDGSVATKLAAARRTLDP
jgi:F-type H+-transporting ATPase subunit delta